MAGTWIAWALASAAFAALTALFAKTGLQGIDSDVATLIRTAMILVVLAAVSEATASGAWAGLSVWTLVALVALSAVLLATVLAATWWGGAWLRLGLPDRVALLMCGSKKSLATGIPMAAVLFTPAAAAAVAVPLIVFHQLQLVVCAVLARRLALRAA